MWNGWNGMGFFGLWFGWIFWIVILALIIWVVMRVAKSGQGTHNMPQHHERPIDILKRRYASGEISKEQFDTMKKDLES